MALSLAQQLMMLQNLPMLMRRELNPVMGINPQDYGPGSPPSSPGGGGFGYGFGGATDPGAFGGPPGYGHEGGRLNHPTSWAGPAPIQSRATDILQRLHVRNDEANDLIRQARRGHITFTPGGFSVDPRFGVYDWTNIAKNSGNPFGTGKAERRPDLVQKALGALQTIEDVHTARRTKYGQKP